MLTLEHIAWSTPSGDEILKGIDLTTCRISGIITSLEAGELKGAVVNMFQAVELAKRFGVIVR